MGVTVDVPVAVAGCGDDRGPVEAVEVPVVVPLLLVGGGSGGSVAAVETAEDVAPFAGAAVGDTEPAGAEELWEVAQVEAWDVLAHVVGPLPAERGGQW